MDGSKFIVRGIRCSLDGWHDNGRLPANIPVIIAAIPQNHEKIWFRVNPIFLRPLNKTSDGHGIFISR